MKKILVKASKSYEVTVGCGILNLAGAKLAALLPPPRHLMLVSDDNVAPLYAARVKSALEDAGYTVDTFIFAAGEASKTTDTLVSLWEAMAAAGLTRTDCAVALGGGVVGDITGFAAATYLRGIACYQIPTSLLAMVDSSVGGKTAVDLPQGKNLCGAFAQPIGVLCDTDVLKTLPEAVFTDGCAEVIKYGYIGDRPLLSLLENSFADDPVSIIARCVEDKRDVVEKDELDNGPRQLLNLGHTGGHAIEKLSRFSISHGNAVAIGMLMAAKAAVAMGLCDPEVPAHQEALLKRYGLPTVCPFEAGAIAKAALSDKKRRGSTITLVIPTALGASTLLPLATDQLADFFRQGGAQ